MFLFRRRPSDLPEAVAAYLDAPRPDAALPWRSALYTVVDLETTGLNPRRDALLSIGLVEIEDGRIQLDRRWRTLVRPPDDAPVNADAIRAHGLLPQDVAHAPTDSEVLPALLRRLTGRVLVVHVAEIDIEFLRMALRRLYRVEPRGPAIDTARLALYLHQGQSGYSARPPALQLRSLAERAGLPAYAEHDSLNDALTAAQLFLSQASELESQGGPLLGDLLRAGGRLR